LNMSKKERIERITPEFFDPVDCKAFVFSCSRKVSALQVVGHTKRYVKCREVPMTTVKYKGNDGEDHKVDWEWILDNPPIPESVSLYSLFTYKFNGRRYFYLTKGSRKEHYEMDDGKTYSTVYDTGYY
jgi:hypothetical protein